MAHVRKTLAADLSIGNVIINDDGDTSLVCRMAVFNEGSRTREWVKVRVESGDFLVFRANRHQRPVAYVIVADK